MKIKFCGAADGVTGSCHLITVGNAKVLLDCGQFQGNKAEEARNYEEFPFNPAEIDAVVLSHAHIDHCGRLPVLVKKGFKGKIFCSDATADLLEVMLKDAAHIQEQETEYANRKNQRAARPLVEPLFDTNDAADTLKFVEGVGYNQLIEVADGIKVVFNDAGHILGSAIIEVFAEEGGKTTKLVFSGDLGMQGRPILRDPVFIKKADVLVMETTYGDRLHEENPTSLRRLLDIAVKTTRRGGNVVIPSFAVGRTQELIYELNKVYDGNSEYSELLKDVPVYVDSPMSIAATEVFKNNAQIYDEEAQKYILSGDHPLEFKNLHFSQTSDESKAINFDPTPKIIISASGMCDAGRIRHHLKYNLWNEKCSVVFVGYQAEGTLGRMLIDGIDSVKLFGDEIGVKAEIYNLQGFSGHADRDSLFNWLSAFEETPSKVFLVHGDIPAKETFHDYVKENLSADTIVVRGIEEYDLEGEISGTQSKAEEQFVDPDTIADARSKLDNLRAVLLDLVDSARESLDTEGSAEKLTALINQISELEKNVVNLGATATKK